MALGIVVVGGNMDPTDYYNKTQADKLLAKKLDLTGGTMSGSLHMAVSDAEIIMLSSDDGSTSAECQYRRTDTGASLGCDVGAYGKNMGLYDGTHKRWLIHTDASTGKIYIGGILCTGFVTASGSNYVRFSDGTQICWGETDQMVVRANSTATATIAYPAAFASGYPVEVSLTIAGNSENDSYSRLVLHTTNRATTNCVIYFKNTSLNSMSPIAQWIVIGRWK